MKFHTRTTTATAAAAATALLLVLTGCSGSGSDSGSGGSATELTYRDADGTCTSGPAEGVDYDTASELIESYQQPITDLVQTEKLPEPVPAGTTVAFLNNDTAVAGIMYAAIQPAAAAAGVDLVNVSTGTDAQSINSALNSVVELNPDVVISEALDGTFFQDQLAQLEANGVAVVYGSQPNAEDFQLNDSLGGYNASVVNGNVLAAGAVAFTCGTGTDFVFYNIPELGFSQIQLDAAKEYLPTVCPTCTLRVVDISIVDPSPADKIVSDLQSHPETDFFVTPADQFQVGLADKAELAGITNAHGFGQSSLPPNVQALADDKQSAGFLVDLNMYMWLQMDEGLRKAQGVWSDYDDWGAVTRSLSTVVTPATADQYLDGFVALPDMQERFTALWGR